MALFRPGGNRIVIPIWRDFETTAKGRELGSLQPAVVRHNFLPWLQERVSSWKRQPSPLGALEILNAALISNHPAEVREVAEFVLKHGCEGNEALQGLAGLLLQNGTGPSEMPDPTIMLKKHEHVVRLKLSAVRASLQRDPYNAVRYVDLAHWNLVNGKLESAERAIKTALHLAPNNRFIIRAAVRFLVHKNARIADEEKASLKQARSLLLASPLVRLDPWIMSAEIGVSRMLGKSSVYTSQGIELVRSGDFSSRHLTELAASVATEELSSGNSKKARGLFKVALEDPNDNSIAQAEWATRQGENIWIDFRQADAFEARSYHQFENAQFDNALVEACAWHGQQPFSRQPIAWASYIAGSLVDDNKKAIELCDLGLLANPEDFILLNNKAYSQAVEGDVEGARRTFGLIDFSKLHMPEEKIIHSATRGMIAYRSGDGEQGSLFYDEAINLAHKEKKHSLELQAKFYKTRAQFLSGYSTISEEEALAQLRTELKPAFGREFDRKLLNLEKRLKQTETGIRPAV